MSNESQPDARAKLIEVIMNAGYDEERIADGILAAFEVRPRLTMVERQHAAWQEIEAKIRAMQSGGNGGNL